MKVRHSGRGALGRRRGERRRNWPRVVALALCLALTLPALHSAPARLLAASRAPAVQHGTYRNPVFDRPFPDPQVLRVGSDYYAYGTTLPWEPQDHLFPILHSRDLVHWTYVGDAFTSSPNWGLGDWWAPDVIERHGTFYLYYVGKGVKAGVHCVAVATAHKPTGPFTPRTIIGCGDTKGQGYIDPAPLVDTNGKAYLYVSVDAPYHNISIIPLKNDLVHAAGPRKELFGLSQSWEFGPSFSTVEGPFPLKHGRLYYLFYSGNDWQHDYAMGYATSSSPMGPFKKYRHNPILRGNARVIGPGGGSVVQGPDGGWWLVYHAWPPGANMATGDQRTMRIDPLRWTGNVVGVRGPTTGREPAP